MRVRVETGAVRARLATLREQRLRAMEAAAEQAAARMQTQARESAPWQDQTGQARASLRGVSGRQGARLICGVSGGMPYSPALEWADAGQHAVLYPVVLREHAQVLAVLAQAVR